MKMRREHFETLRDGMLDTLQRYSGASAVSESNGVSLNQFRWSTLYATRIEGYRDGGEWVCRTQYPDGLNDTHIETALRRIMPVYP